MLADSQMANASESSSDEAEASQRGEVGAAATSHEHAFLRSVERAAVSQIKSQQPQFGGAAAGSEVGGAPMASAGGATSALAGAHPGPEGAHHALDAVAVPAGSQLPGHNAPPIPGQLAAELNPASQAACSDQAHSSHVRNGKRTRNCIVGARIAFCAVTHLAMTRLMTVFWSTIVFCRQQVCSRPHPNLAMSWSPTR